MAMLTASVVAMTAKERILMKLRVDWSVERRSLFSIEVGLLE